MLKLLRIDAYGQMLDRRFLDIIYQHFDGGPGFRDLAASLGEERGTIEEVDKPF